MRTAARTTSRALRQSARRNDTVAEQDIIDHNGYRRGVGIVVCDGRGRVLLARRSDHRGWQFPQGGVRRGEPARAAMYRELREELGLEPSHVREVARMGSWVSYRLPARYRRSRPARCIGQKQLWWLLQLRSSEDNIRPDLCEEREFDDWQWVDYWLPAKEVVFFKQSVYKQVLSEFQDSAGLRATRKLR